ncbi:hypothetical protein VOLCADRAFT_120491 [Volvox carteri f. nagariensis]|uniref:Phospholipid/glycerol acyltransferase domain-containing protein n=1 Tax=Volvox carteri f. nagariensis TaxID=3068 RepID=D8TME8_VOLCA|nr:uncharacterized protein VOLCADRAFT_120491 [Volvox carteri f. nagariensis]EFJ51113.1 hypothetical protein VOLCADRAFT_120491 [Volvox carteri f. nagariensis]|eukprot:XP_002947580.1 hypothetical protein VOLCADRAFT_120491 [Volvox carteri f. nagariensis]
MSVPSKALSLPSFLFSVFVFYWSLPLFAIIYRIRFANVGKRNDMLDWAKALVAFFRVTVLKQGEMSLYRGGRCLYLCNHRSWADFFIDTYLTEGRAALMSRWMVFFAFPVFCTSVLILRGIVLFKRGHIADKETASLQPIEEAFNVWLDATLRKSTVPGLLVYPEGHRSLKPRSLPLKRGMLHFAFSRHLAVQLIITRGKEEVIKPTDFDSFDAFFQEVQTTWDACWQLSYHQPTEGVPRLSLKDAHEYDYPPSMWWLQLGVTLLSIVLLAAVLYGSWLVLRAGILSLGSSGTQQTHRYVSDVPDLDQLTALQEFMGLPGDVDLQDYADVPERRMTLVLDLVVGRTEESAKGCCQKKRAVFEISRYRDYAALCTEGSQVMHALDGVITDLSNGTCDSTESVERISALPAEGVGETGVEGARRLLNYISFFGTPLGEGAWQACRTVMDRRARAASILDEPFTLEEVARAVGGLPNGKAHGLEVAPSECYRYARLPRVDEQGRQGTEVNCIVPVLHVLLAHIRTTGDFPQQFTKTVVSPILKKGDPLVAGNYWGIAVGGAFAKCYASVILNRLVRAGETLDLRHPCQAGFRLGFGTAHHLFVKQHLVRRRRSGGCPALRCRRLPRR